MAQTPLNQMPFSYRTQSPDTSPDVEQILIQRWREMLPTEKAKLVRNATKRCWQLSLIGIWNQHSYLLTMKQVRQEFIRRRFGVEWIQVLCNEDYWGKFEDIVGIETVMEDAVWLALKLAEILEGLDIPYLVGGSVASSLLGEPRATLDLDLVVDLHSSQIELLIAAMTGEFYLSIDAVTDAVERKASFNAIHLETTEKADFFVLGDDAFSQSKLRRRQIYRLPGQFGQSIYIYSAEDIILQKLRWYRMGFSQSDRQWRDVLGVLKVQAEHLDFEYLRLWGQRLGLDDELSKAFRESGLQE
ncbi:hypothetical protein [Scytonema sp. NUACC26]|uniref:hypothetical protein n=1 Tax=Scytonema sp. NUACC26 TaxID=3140176 RepID=UPI0034DC4CF9